MRKAKGEQDRLMELGADQVAQDFSFHHKWQEPEMEQWNNIPKYKSKTPGFRDKP